MCNQDSSSDIQHLWKGCSVGHSRWVKHCSVLHNIKPDILAEEGGSGKLTLLEKGAYKGMDACLM